MCQIVYAPLLFLSLTFLSDHNTQHSWNESSHIYHLLRVVKSPKSSIPIVLLLHLELEFNRNILTKHFVHLILPRISRLVQTTALWRVCQFLLGNDLQLQEFLKQHSEWDSVSDYDTSV